MKNTKYIARLVVPKMPKTDKDKEQLIKWLRNIAKEIKKEDYRIFAKPCRMTLLK